LTSGQLDPWRAAGIQSLPNHASDSIIVRIIDDGAHHLDLRSTHPMDPPSVRKIREEELENFIRWIQQWQEMYPSSSSSKHEQEQAHANKSDLLLRGSTTALFF
jgi:acetoin utilization deacetylase AcuC-like enzyme